MAEDDPNTLRVRRINKKSKYDSEDESDGVDFGPKGKRKGKSLRPVIPKQKKKTEVFPEEHLLTVPADKLASPFLNPPPPPYFTSPSSSLLSTSCCVPCSNRNVLRAAKTNNPDLLKRCMAETKVVGKLLTTFGGPECRWTPMEYAFLEGNLQMVEMMLKYDRNVRRKGGEPRVNAH